MANVELINQLEAWIIEQDELREAGKPSEWDQTTWGRQTDCGTAYCIAGKAVQLQGYALDYQPTHGYSAPDNGQRVAWRAKDGRLIKDVARLELELTELEAELLFDEDNDLETLQGYFEELRAGRGIYSPNQDFYDDDDDDDNFFTGEGYAEE